MGTASSSLQARQAAADRATERLSLQLQLEEAESCLASIKPTTDTADPDNDYVVVQTFRYNVQRQLDELDSTALAIRLAHSDDQDRRAIEQLLERDQQVHRDQTIAELLQAEEIAGKGDAKSNPKKRSHEEAFQYESHVQCVACMEQKPAYEMIQLGCRPVLHHYCPGCLRGLFEAAMTDVTLFPPKCCKIPIEMGYIKYLFTDNFSIQFEDKKLELATPNPTYCHNQECSKFIKPANIETEAANCTSCNTKTCLVCKDKSHDGQICTEPANVKSTLAHATEKGWRRCSKCATMVELAHGCNHITCHCKAEWCYACGAEWHTCTCPMWSEEHLIERDRIRLARLNQDPAPANVAAVNRAPANQVPAHPPPFVPAANRECQHPYWEQLWRRDGNDTECEVCQDDLLFIMRCNDCDTQVCRRCRQNRL